MTLGGSTSCLKCVYLVFTLLQLRQGVAALASVSTATDQRVRTPADSYHHMRLLSSYASLLLTVSDRCPWAP